MQILYTKQRPPAFLVEHIRSPPPRIRFRTMLPRAPKFPKSKGPLAAAGPAAGSAPSDRQETVATGDRKLCAELENRVALLIEENERMVMRAAHIEIEYTRLEQKYEALIRD